MMAGAWEINSKALMTLYIDNEGVVKGFSRMRKAIGRNGDGKAPVFPHSVDLWNEVEHWCRKWKQRFTVIWIKSHPEDRDSTGVTWLLSELSEWLNHTADRMADAEYDREADQGDQRCLRHQRRWRLEWKRTRVTSVSMDA